MVFKSVFGSLSEVRDAIESGRIDSQNLTVRVDKTSLGVFLSDKSQYFDGYDSEDYYMSPDTKHEQQVLFHDVFGRPQELCVELLAEFLGGEEYKTVNYRGREDSTNFTD